MAVQCRTPDGSEWLLNGASPTVKHQGPLWHEDRPLSLGMQAVEDDPWRVTRILELVATTRPFDHHGRPAGLALKNVEFDRPDVTRSVILSNAMRHRIIDDSLR